MGTESFPEFLRDHHVLVTAPNFFKGSKLGVVLGPCRDHENSYRVYLFDPRQVTKEVCVNPLQGDTIISAEKDPPLTKSK